MANESEHKEEQSRGQGASEGQEEIVLEEVVEEGPGKPGEAVEGVTPPRLDDPKTTYADLDAPRLAGDGAGEREIPADELENVPKKTGVSQWVFIVIATILLIGIALTFHDAGPRENHAAQATFSVLTQPIINSAAESTGLRTSWGYPVYTLNARVKEADIFAQFLHGPIPPEKAREFGLLVCERLARAYVVKGYMARHITVHVYSRQDAGPRRYYGKAVYNGNLDDLVWEGAPEYINGGPGMSRPQ